MLYTHLFSYAEVPKTNCPKSRHLEHVSKCQINAHQVLLEPCIIVLASSCER